MPILMMDELMFMELSIHTLQKALLGYFLFVNSFLYSSFSLLLSDKLLALLEPVRWCTALRSFILTMNYCFLFWDATHKKGYPF